MSLKLPKILLICFIESNANDGYAVAAESKPKPTFYGK